MSREATPPNNTKNIKWSSLLDQAKIGTCHLRKHNLPGFHTFPCNPKSCNIYSMPKGLTNTGDHPFGTFTQNCCQEGILTPDGALLTSLRAQHGWERQKAIFVDSPVHGGKTHFASRNETLPGVSMTPLNMGSLPKIKGS